MILVVAIAAVGCNSIFGPGDSKHQSGVFEILYHQVYPIVNPDVDMTINAVEIYNINMGHQNSSRFIPAGEKQWTAETTIWSDPAPYYFSVRDYQLFKAGDESFTVGEEILVRKKGDANWIKGCIVDNPVTTGKATKIFFSNGTLSAPCN